jgi:hypothetical protein
VSVMRRKFNDGKPDGKIIRCEPSSHSRHKVTYLFCRTFDTCFFVFLDNLRNLLNMSNYVVFSGEPYLMEVFLLFYRLPMHSFVGTKLWMALPLL